MVQVEEPSTVVDRSTGCLSCCRRIGGPGPLAGGLCGRYWSGAPAASEGGTHPSIARHDAIRANEGAGGVLWGRVGAARRGFHAKAAEFPKPGRNAGDGDTAGGQQLKVSKHKEAPPAPENNWPSVRQPTPRLALRRGGSCSRPAPGPSCHAGPPVTAVAAQSLGVGEGWDRGWGRVMVKEEWDTECDEARGGREVPHDVFQNVQCSCYGNRTQGIVLQGPRRAPAGRKQDIR
ncbi:unnamed protein product [Gadus morhua 'NCC']